MFAKIKSCLPISWLFQGLIISCLGVLLIPGKTLFFIGFGSILLSSLIAQLVLSMPFPMQGLQRYWVQLISAQACKWSVFSIIMYWTISYKFIDETLFFGVIVAQLVVFWNYRKYG